MTYFPNFNSVLNSIVRTPAKALILIGAILSATLPQAEAQNGTFTTSPATTIQDMIGEINGEMYFTSKVGTSSQFDIFKMDTSLNVTRVTTGTDVASYRGNYFIDGTDIYYKNYQGTATRKLNTLTGTVEVNDLTHIYAQDWFEYNGEVFFVAQENSNRNLYKIDGSNNIIQVTDWNDGLASTISYNEGFVVKDGKLYTGGFASYYSCSSSRGYCAQDNELVIVDLATGIGTFHDIEPGTGSSYPRMITQHGDLITIWVENTSAAMSSSSPQVYLYNTVTGSAPEMITNLNGYMMMMMYTPTIESGGKIFIQEEYGNVYVYDTSAHTFATELTDTAINNVYQILTEHNGSVYIVGADTQNDQYVFKVNSSDLTVTKASQEVFGFSSMSYSSDYAELDEGVYALTANLDQNIGYEPMIWDLANDSMTVAYDARSGSSGSSAYNYMKFGSYIYAWGYTGSSYQWFRFQNNYVPAASNTAPTLTNDYITINEDEPVVLVDGVNQQLFNDVDGDPMAGIRFDSLPSYGTLTMNGTPVVAGQEYTPAQLDSIVYTPGADLNGFDHLIWNATDGEAYADDAARITFEIVPVNDAPIVYDLTVQATEDVNTHIPSQFNISIFTDVDGDAMDIFQLRTEPAHGVLTVQGMPLSAGDTISASQATLLIYTPDANYTGADQFTWNATDGTVYADSSATIDINVSEDNDAPSSVTLHATSLDENVPVGTFVGAITATDVDQNDFHTFALVSGTGDDDNVSFAVRNDSLFTVQNIDFESTSRMSVRLQAIDRAGLTVEDYFSIDINDMNDAPSTLVMANTTIDENATVGSIVSNVYAFDEDAVDDYTLTLVSGAGDADNASFAVSGKNLVTNTTFDYNAQQIYSVRLRATDLAGAWIEESFTIGINDVNGAPTDITLSSSSILEDQAVGSYVGTLGVVDADQVDTHTYQLVSGTGDSGNASFSINGADLLSTVSFDHETQSSYSIRVQVTDGSNASYEKVFTISITNVNDAPTAVALSNNVVAEDAASGTTIGTLSASDIDLSDSHTFTLVQGVGSDDNSSFSISGDQFILNAALDYETKTSYTVRVRATDASNASVEETFMVYVSDVNEAPTTVTVTVLNIDENSLNGSTIGYIGATDPDGVDTTHTFTLVNGAGAADNGSFSILGNKLQVADAFDFESKSSYEIRLRATDLSGAYKEQSFTVSINDVNEVPSAITEQVMSLTENEAIGTVAASLTTTDVDAGDSHTYALVAGAGDTDNALFSISGSDLVVNGTLNWEAQQTYSVRVATYDQGNLSVEKVISISITDINDAPTASVLTKSTTSGSTVTYSTREFSSVFADEDAGDALTSIRIDALPQVGTLYLKTNTLQVGDVVMFSELSDIRYQAVPVYTGTDNFMWSPNDGTAFADAPATATINISLSRVAGNSVTVNQLNMGSLMDNMGSTGGVVRTASEESYTGVEELVKLELSSYPNPFSASTNIRFTLANDQRVEVEVYDMLGRNIKQLADGEFAQGEHTINWNADKLEQGKYFIRLIVKDMDGKVVDTKTTTVVKL